jgi:6-pyruvoyltetrahydropterin/6-carboxytetrahydropterin synthase
MGIYRVGVGDHVMIAHSLRGETFGPAQRLHGATYVVEAEVRAESLDEDGIVIDIGKLAGELRQVLAELDYQNLDDLPALRGRNTTTEFLASWIHERLGRRLAGRAGMLSITLKETPTAWAAFEAPLPTPEA